MSKEQESLKTEIYGLLKSRGLNPVSKESSGDTVPIPTEADVFEFMFSKDGKDYGKVWVTLDGLRQLIVYFGKDVADSPKNGSQDSNSWSQLHRALSRFATGRQLSFELSDQSNLEADMAKREHTKREEQVNEGYYPIGKNASGNNNVPSVTMRIQHTRPIEEGEQRFRNIARIFVENQDGERILLPTTKPGLARTYVRHIAEGGKPNDERWNHLGSLCEEYQKMAGFVRATRNGQFNESAQSLVNEGINHYQKLRETLGKLQGKRGYNEYFESYTPALMEDEEQIDLSEMFMSSSLDPRIESVMPILSKLSRNITETKKDMAETIALGEWADSLMDSTTKQTKQSDDDEDPEEFDYDSPEWQQTEKGASKFMSDVKKREVMKRMHGILSKNREQGVAEAGFPGAPDVEMPPMNPSGDPQRDKLKQEYVDLHREIKSLVDLQYNSKSTEEKMQAKARIKQLNDRADQIRAILEPRQPPNEWQKKTYGYDDNWNRVGKGVAESDFEGPYDGPIKFQPGDSQAYRDAYAQGRSISIQNRAADAEKTLAQRASEPKNIGQKIARDIGDPLKQLAKGNVMGALFDRPASSTNKGGGSGFGGGGTGLGGRRPGDDNRLNPLKLENAELARMLKHAKGNIQGALGEGIVPKPYMPPGLASATTPPSDDTSRGWLGHEWDPEQDADVEHLTFQTKMQTTEKPGMKPTTTYDTQNTSSKTGITSTHEVDVDEGLSRLRELAGVQGMAEADRPGLPPKLNPHGMSQAQIDDRMTSVGFIPGTRDHATAVQLYRAANPNTARPVSKPLPRSHIQGTDVGPLPLPRSDIQGTDVGPLPLSPLGRGQDNPHSPVTNVDLTPQRDEFSPNPDIGPHSQPFSVDIRGYGPEPDEFGRQHNGSHESEIEMEEGSVEKTPTGLKHHGDFPGYPREKGKEFNHNIDRLNKSETGKLDKAFGVNWNRGPNRQVTGDSTGVTEGQADLNTIKRLLGK